MKEYGIIFLHLFLALNLNAQTVNRAYVGGGYGTGVDVINVDSMTIITTIPGAGGYRMVLTPDGKKLYSTGGNTLVYV